MTHEELESAVPLYAAGTLEQTKRQALDAHLLSGCASCHQALKAYQSGAASLQPELGQTDPPPEPKASPITAQSPRTAHEDNLKKRPVRSSLEPGDWVNHLFPPISPARSLSLPWAIALVTILTVGLIGYLTWNFEAQRAEDTSKIQQLESSLQEQSTTLASVQSESEKQAKALAELRSEVQERTSEAAEAKNQLARRDAQLKETRLQLNQKNLARAGRTPQDELASLLRRPDILAFSLAGSDLAKRASAFLLYDPLTHKIWFYAVNLPESPSGKTYQLWASHGKPVSIGTFHMDRGDTAHLLVKKVANFTGAKTFSVSLEPAGGRPQPTGPAYLLSRS